MTHVPTSAPAVSVHPSRAALGAAAGALAGQHLRAVLQEQERATVMLAAAPSQSATLDALAAGAGTSTGAAWTASTWTTTSASTPTRRRASAPGCSGSSSTGSPA